MDEVDHRFNLHRVKHSLQAVEKNSACLKVILAITRFHRSEAWHELIKSQFKFMYPCFHMSAMFLFAKH